MGRKARKLELEKCKMGPIYLKSGDRLKLYFAASDGLWRRSWQAFVIEWRLGSHPEDFVVTSIDYQQKGQLIFTIEIKQSADALLTEKAIANLILAYNPKGFYLIFKNATVEFVEQKVKPFVKAVGGGLEYAALLIIAILGLMVLEKRASN